MDLERYFCLDKALPISIKEVRYISLTHPTLVGDAEGTAPLGLPALGSDWKNSSFFILDSVS